MLGTAEADPLLVDIFLGTWEKQFVPVLLTHSYYSQNYTGTFAAPVVANQLSTKSEHMNLVVKFSNKFICDVFMDVVMFH